MMIGLPTSASGTGNGPGLRSGAGSKAGTTRMSWFQSTSAAPRWPARRPARRLAAPVGACEHEAT